MKLLPLPVGMPPHRESRRRGARATAASAGRRSAKVRVAGLFVRMRARIVASWIVRGEIVGGQTRSALRDGCEVNIV
jgi:hypothetical protein